MKSILEQTVEPVPLNVKHIVRTVATRKENNKTGEASFLPQRYRKHLPSFPRYCALGRIVLYHFSNSCITETLKLEQNAAYVTGVLGLSVSCVY